MVNIFTAFLAVLLFLGSTVHATTYAPFKIALADADVNGIRAYFYSNGTIQELGSSGVPSNAPSGYSTWFVDFNFASPPTGITNVSPASNFAAFGYISPVNGEILRVFYQTTNGDIRSVFHMTLWTLDPTVLANVPLGSPITALRQTDSTGAAAIVVQYTDANGLLTQRVLVTDTGNWSPAITVTT